MCQTLSGIETRTPRNHGSSNVVHDLLNAGRSHDCEDTMTQLRTPYFASYRFATVLALVLVAGCGASHPALGPESGNDAGSDGKGPVTEVTLERPASLELGWQYEVPAFSVDPGTEVQQCFFF